MDTKAIGKILVVDDEVELKNILVEAFTSQGYLTSGFTTGEAALAALRCEAFDILLTDLMMPEMDGITLARESLQIDPHLVAIMMTGHGTIQTAVDAMKVGVFDYVLKPFPLQTVFLALTRAMNTRHVRLENLQLRETVAIYELAQTIAFTLDPQTLLSKLADAALLQTHADEVSVLLPTSDGADELYVAAVRGEKRCRLLGERVSLEESISGWVAREKEPLMLKGEVRDNRFHSLWPRPEIRSAISIPMQVANKLIGTINVNAVNRPRPFTLGQKKGLTILASTAAAALESASLYTQLQKAEGNYRSIFENAVEGIFQSTPEGRFITMNPAMADILGYASPAEAVEGITDIEHQIYVDPAGRSESERIQAEQGFLNGFEFEAYRKDGEKIWLSVNRRSIRDQHDVEIYREGFVKNITTRKRAEEALRETVRSKDESLAVLNTILSTAPIGFAFHNRNLVYERINESLAAINGLPVEAHIGRTVREVLPELAPELEPYLKRVVETGLPTIDLELSGETPADPGSKHYWLVSFYPVQMKGGEILGVGVLVSEITERKRAEEALRESEERYRNTVENAHDIIYSHDLQGKYTSINTAGETIMGYTRAEVLTLNLAQTVAPECVVKVKEMLRRKLAGEEVTNYEMEIIAKDGRRVAVEANTRLVYQDGVPVGVQGIARDVTVRKQLEEQLRQSQKMEAIGQLAGGVAHDFNNLLTVINGYSRLGLQGLDANNPLGSYLEEIKKAGDRAANLTRQLLAFGRKQILQPRALNLNDIVSDMNKMLRRLIGEDIRFATKLAPKLKLVRADPGQIEQVLLNLVVNARDSMPQGGSLTIETDNVELDREYANQHVGVQPGHFVVLAVSDTGIGMDEETQSRIFEPFFTTKAKDKGTGLGLSTVYGIVKQSGGNIWVYSEPGHGTALKVYFPVLDLPYEQLADISVESEVRGGSETILLVEDEEIVRRLARKILEQTGYEVLEASHGEEAVRLCGVHAKPIHLLLTDVVMPGTSGKEVADRLSSMRPEIKVLFMSGYTDEAIVHQGVLNSSVEFIQKPFTPATLSRKVREVLDSNGNARALQPE